MTRFSIHPQARTEFDEAFVHYLGIDPELAVSFEATFFDYLDGIIANPLLYNLRRPPTRRANLLPRFGEYYIAYMIWKDKPVILAIAHGARRPYYWRKRIVESKKLF
jgi:plasmid stabilization system protein ParE